MAGHENWYVSWIHREAPLNKLMCKIFWLKYLSQITKAFLWHLTSDGHLIFHHVSNTSLPTWFVYIYSLVDLLLFPDLSENCSIVFVLVWRCNQWSWNKVASTWIGANLNNVHLIGLGFLWLWWLGCDRQSKLWLLTKGQRGFS